MNSNKARQYIFQLISDYEKGLYTHNEMISKIYELAAEESISNFVDSVPNDVLEEIRINPLVTNPIASADKIFLVHYNSTEDENKILAAANKWHKYFYS
jgi:hypothetical protein